MPSYHVNHAVIDGSSVFTVTEDGIAIEDYTKETDAQKRRKGLQKMSDVREKRLFNKH